MKHILLALAFVSACVFQQCETALGGFLGSDSFFKAPIALGNSPAAAWDVKFDALSDPIPDEIGEGDVTHVDITPTYSGAYVQADYGVGEWRTPEGTQHDVEDFTLGFVIEFDAVANRYLFSLGKGNTAADYSFLIQTTASGARVFVSDGSATDTVTATYGGTRTTGVKYYVVFDYDREGAGSSMARIHFAEEGDCSNWNTGTLNTARLMQQNNTFYLRNAQASTAGLNGKYWRSTLWRKVLSDEERTAFCENGSETDTYNLSYWPGFTLPIAA